MFNRIAQVRVGVLRHLPKMNEEGTIDNITVEFFTIKDDRTAGILYVIFAALFLIAAFLIFWILASTAHLRQHWTYHILLHIFSNNGFQLTVHLLGGIMNISHSNLNYWLDKTAGAALTTTTNVQVVLLFALAINRLQVITNGPLFYYSSDNTVYKSLLCFAYLLGLFFFVSHMTPFTGFSFNRLCNCWLHFSGPFTRVVSAIDRFVSITVAVFTLSIYCYLFIYGIKNRIFTTLLSSALKNERNLFVISAVMFVYAFVLIVVHCFADGSFDSTPKYVIFDMFWINYCGTFQIVHLAFNSEMLMTAKQKFSSRRKIEKKPIVKVAIRRISNEC